ncbi:MAG TPA: hypothetical protein VH025_06785, partial [Solirubrobacteraceae bacterium]|nr:hypothetical protein [Solirubrobacteraceae bacterium]
MASLLADSAAEPKDGAQGAAQPGPEEPHGASQSGAEGRCGSCGAAMAPGQDWCLDCGVGAPGTVGTPGWRSAVTILGATAVLVLGAAGAGYAALSKHDEAPARTVAQTPPQTAPTTTAPTTSTPLPVVPGTTSTPSPSLPSATATPPKIPLTTTPTGGTTTEKTKPKAKETTGGGKDTGGAETEAEPILLDTDAA